MPTKHSNGLGMFFITHYEQLMNHISLNKGKARRYTKSPTAQDVLLRDTYLPMLQCDLT